MTSIRPPATTGVSPIRPVRLSPQSSRTESPLPTTVNPGPSSRRRAGPPAPAPARAAAASRPNRTEEKRRWALTALVLILGAGIAAARVARR
ncbi:MAG TPA: hypothetical protein VJT49_05410 [Amycolatopsis sp.]|nr:hypothetical protein [Amycolatopsis sp.]